MLMPQSFRRCWLTEVSSGQLLTEGESHSNCGEQKLFSGKRFKSQASAKTYITYHDLTRHHNHPTRIPIGGGPTRRSTAVGSINRGLNRLNVQHVYGIWASAKSHTLIHDL
ncbi:hypothetical protein Adt_11214 [Abeliophyllum distichum]|uniref:Uncharacterized protein n=1 Tax=Abeliophyllum distichum TaxID=126358 RepID=A0ABD1UNQ4_9LAMI